MTTEPKSTEASVAVNEGRRTALGVGLGLVGYAAAAGPLMAHSAVVTSTDGLEAGRTSYAVNGFNVPAYLAKPAGKQGLPVVLVVQEIFGLHTYIEDVCRRFAQQGYLAIAPEMYARQGDPSKYQDIQQLMADIVSKVPDAQVMTDLDGAVRFAGTQGGDLSKVGVTGFCWGGRATWLYAAHGPVKAGVAWYGRLEGASSELTPKHPVDIAPILRAPVLGLYGEADSGIPMEQVRRMEQALLQGSDAAKASRFVIYPEAPHAFHADYRPSFRAGPAQDGWKRCLEWMRQHGVA